MCGTGSWQILSRAVLTGVMLLAVPAALHAQGGKTVAPPGGTPINITVSQAGPAAAPASFVLGSRHGHATPVRQGCTHTGGGNIDVAQPSADTLVITMTGVAVAYGSPCGGATATINFDLDQCFEIVFDNPKLKKAKITVDARVIGLLRSHCKGGSAGYANACVAITSGSSPLVSLCVPPHTVAGGENLSVNDHDGPLTVPVAAGKYTLRQTFSVTAVAPRCLWPHKAPSAEFAPDPALDPLWISYKEPFHGAAKKDFGFQVTIKLAEET